MRILSLFFIVLLLLSSCSSESDSREQSNKALGDSLPINYAEGFSATNDNGIWTLTIHKPYPNARRGFTYLLVPHEKDIPDHPASTQVIRIPVNRMISTSTTHIPLLNYLDETAALIGFPNPDYISSEKMRQRIDSGNVANIGIDKAMELEKILDLDPDMVMGYSMSSDLGQMERLREAGIPYLLNSDYLESHPLGRAEWIKVAGLLLGKSDQADSVFNYIASEYERLYSMASAVSTKPDVFSGVVYGDTWFLPGGNNYAARLMNDAGMKYLWSENTSYGFLELSFEAILNKAQNADLWIGVASFNNLDEMRAAETRYSLFKAFERGEVYTYNKRIGATGGNEYLELGYLRPDLILGDLIHIAHPELLPEHSMYFYVKLE